MSEQDKFEPENRNEDPIDYNFLTNSSMGMIPISNPMSICKGDLLESSSCSSAPIVNSFPPIIWDHPTNSHNLAFCDITHTNYSSSRINKAGFVPPRTVDMGWTPPNSLLKGGIYVPNPALSQFPADSGFIERAARFSCFGAGNFGDMMNPFSAPPSLTLIQDNSLSVEHGVNEGSPVHNEKKSESFVKSPDEAKESGEAEFSGGGGQEEQSQSSNKRKRSGDQDNEFEKVKGTVEPTMEAKKGGENPTLKNNRVSGKNGTDLVKEDYIHIRARRGQATNSHSLAERVRREKISERMKFLQDLVPGCSKVTGKAVMLDEIINYVQSLQRQVEFLSMKLATVNPRHDFSIEGLLAKDILQSQACSSSIHGFHHDRTMPYHHQQLLSSQAGLISNAGSYSNTLRGSGSSQLTAMSGGYKESTSQAPNVWEDELHNVIQLMGFNPSAPLSTQDLSGHMKDEP